MTDYAEDFGFVDCEGCGAPIYFGDGRYTADDVFLCDACYKAVPASRQLHPVDSVTPEREP